MIHSSRLAVGSCLLGGLLLLVEPASAQRRQVPQGPPPIRGPLFSATIRGENRNDGTIAMKGIVVRVGKDKDAWVCYDADLMRVSRAWTGDFLDFGNTINQIAWPPPPRVLGTAMFGTDEGPGWAKDGSFADPRDQGMGPLPKDWAHYKGLYQFGERIIVSYKVGAVGVLETPDYAEVGGQKIFTRTIQFESAANGEELLLASKVKGTVATELKNDGTPTTVSLDGGGSLAIAGAGGVPEGSKLETTSNGNLILKLGHAKSESPFRLAFSSSGDAKGFNAARAAALEDLRKMTKGGPKLWNESVVTKGEVGTGDEPYLVDTITEPTDNPWNARTFFSGFDFFSDGRAAICTFHGDVFIVSGIDDTMQNLRWTRYATGLFQPLGLKIVNDDVYVLGRDQITHLHDLNHDGEADFYENFNNDIVVTSNYHEFALDLHTDPEGNFYFCKGSPWEPNVTSPSQGNLYEVTKDGSKLIQIASGLRAPNGMTVGPHGEITVSDNQGHWMPSSKLNWIHKGGFYGMTPAAHETLTMKYEDGTTLTGNPSDPEFRKAHNLKGYDKGMPIPEDYDKPFVWLPQNMDNSSGGQTFVTSDKWGPFKGHLLFTSYGKCTLFEVMTDVVDGVRQGAMEQFPLKFYSGLMRARFNPNDGQLYLAGLKGWQTAATKDGGFYRVRYTGKPVYMSESFHAAENGVQVGFTCKLDPKTANDAGSWAAERWNYFYSGSYGSPEFSVDHPGQKGHDKLEIKSAKLLPDGKTVFLEIPNMKPCDQFKLRFSLDAADGGLVDHELYATIYKMGKAE